MEQKSIGTIMKVGDLLKHTASGQFVVVIALSTPSRKHALICFTTGTLVGYQQWYSTDYLEVISESR